VPFLYKKSVAAYEYTVSAWKNCGGTVVFVLGVSSLGGVLSILQKMPWAVTYLLVLLFIASSLRIAIWFQQWFDRNSVLWATQPFDFKGIRWEVQQWYPGSIKETISVPHSLCIKCNSILFITGPRSADCTDSMCREKYTFDEDYERANERARLAAHVEKRKGKLTFKARKI
jgi:hypothetical protein